MRSSYSVGSSVVLASVAAGENPASITQSMCGTASTSAAGAPWPALLRVPFGRHEGHARVVPSMDGWREPAACSR